MWITVIFFSIPPASERVSHWLLPASGLYHHCGLCFLASIIFESIKVLVAQSCLTLCDLMDHSPPCSSVHRILQARILEWVAIPISIYHLWKELNFLFYIPRVVCFPGWTLTDIVFIQNLFYMYMNFLWYKILVRSRMGVFQFYKCSVGSYYVQSGYIGNNLLIVTQSGSKNLRSAKSFFSGQWNIIDSINFLPAYNKKILGDGNIYECSCLNCVKVRAFSMIVSSDCLLVCILRECEQVHSNCNLYWLSCRKS